MHSDRKPTIVIQGFVALKHALISSFAMWSFNFSRPLYSKRHTVKYTTQSVETQIRVINQQVGASGLDRLH